MNKFLFFIFIFFLSIPVFSAELKYNLDDSKIILNIKFSKPFSIISKSVKNNSYVININTNEEVNINQEFWGVPLANIKTKQVGKNLEIELNYLGKALLPRISLENNSLNIFIIIPKESNESYSAGKTYIRLFVGLIIMIIFILVIYAFIKIFFKKNISSEIAGVGRGLGKVDIMPGKSLYFYELGEHIYILGVTSDSINLIDKIDNETDVNLIKSGFNKMKDFSSYFKFFNKQNDIKKDFDITSTIIKDKVDSLKKK